MKINFGSKDSIYKIFKTLEKLPKNKQIEIFIDPENSFFENLWWGKQVVNLIEDKGIDYKFVCKDFKTKDYFKNLGVDCEFDKLTIFANKIKKFKDYIFLAKSIHSQVLKKKNYASFLIVVFEVGVISFVLYILYSLISPHANVYIKPSYNLEKIAYNLRFYPADKNNFQDSQHISVPFHTGNAKVNYTISQTVDNIKYMQEPSSGKVEIINTTNRSYSIVANTKFVTNDNRLFKSNNWFKIPASNDSTESSTIVSLQAMDRDDDGKIMGKRGNIEKGTELYIKELNQSYYLKNVYAKAINNFQGGETDSQGTVSQSDLNRLKDQLKSYIHENKKSIVKEENLTNNNKIILKKDDFYSFHTENISFNASTGDNISNLKGTINANIKYRYILRKDLKNAFEKYLKKRDPRNLQLVNLDRKSLMFFDKYSFNNYFVIPAKIDVVWGYDFQQDINNIKDRIKSKIIGKNVPKAKEEVLSFPEIDVAIVELSPPWYNNIPQLKSRIDININKN